VAFRIEIWKVNAYIYKPSLTACLSTGRAGWAVRRFGSFMCSEVPDVVLCLWAQGERPFLYTVQYGAVLVPRRRACQFLSNRSFQHYHGRGKACLSFDKDVRSYERAVREFASLWLRQRRSHRQRNAFTSQTLVAHALLHVRRHLEEHLLDVAIVPVVGSFLSSSTRITCWVTDDRWKHDLAIRFGMNVSSGPFAHFQAAKPYPTANGCETRWGGGR
jgi:hypothetical protein